MFEPLHLSTQRGFDLQYAENTPDTILSTTCYFTALELPKSKLIHPPQAVKFSYLTNASNPISSNNKDHILNFERSLMHMTSHEMKITDILEENAAYRFHKSNLKYVSAFSDNILLKDTEDCFFIIQASRTNIEKIAIFIEAYYMNSSSS